MLTSPLASRRSGTSSFKYYLCHCVLVSVAQADPPTLGSEPIGNLQSFASQYERWLAVKLIDDFHILPAYPLAPTGPDGFEGSFLGGKTSRVMLELIGTDVTVLDFTGRKGPVAQTIPSSDHRQPELFNFDNIYPNSDDQLPHPQGHGQQLPLFS